MNQKEKQEVGKLARPFSDKSSSWFTILYPSHGAQLSLMDYVCERKASFELSKRGRNFLKLTGASFKTEGDNQSLIHTGIKRKA